MQANLQAILNAIDAGIFVIEAENIIYSNDRAYEILGLPANERISSHQKYRFIEFTTVFDLINHVKKTGKDIKDKEISRYGNEKLVIDIKKLDNYKSKEDVFLCIFDFKTDNGQDGVKDVPSESISKISHELRTRLSAIKGSIENVLDGILGEVASEQRRFLSIAVESVDKLTQLVEDLLNSLKGKDGKISIRKKWVDINDIVKSSINSVRAIAQKEKIKLFDNTKNKNFRVYCDPDKIEQVIFNLLENAIKYTKPSGSVKVDIDDFPQYLELSVTDTGIGIPHDKLKKLSQRQSDKKITFAGKEETKRSGLGLVIIREILEAHGSNLKVESTHGKGSKFSFNILK